MDGPRSIRQRTDEDQIAKRSQAITMIKEAMWYKLFLIAKAMDESLVSPPEPDPSDCSIAHCSSGGQWKKKQKQHSSQQKQHNRKSTQHRIIVYIHPLPFRSIAVCIGVRTAILHRCSHLAFISPAGIGARTLPFTVRWSYRLALFRVVFLLSALRSVKTTRRRNEDSGLARRRDGRET